MDDIERIPNEIFKEADLKLDKLLLNFLVAASQHSINKGPWVQATSTVFSTKILERALKNHADALNASAKASEKHAANLTYATWALVFATIVLGIVSMLPVFGVGK